MRSAASRIAAHAAAVLLTFTALVSAAVAAEARSAPAASAAGQEVTVLRARHVFDGTGTQLRDGVSVVIRGDRIVSVGTGQDPAGARVVELGDVTLLPGFIDAHVHLDSEASERGYYEDFFNGLMRFPAEEAHYAALYARRTLEAGFTTVRNVGANDYVDVGLRNAINAGIVTGPRMLTAVHAIGSPGGHGDQAPFPPDRVRPLGPIEGICTGPEQCRDAVREQMKWGADVIKIIASGGVFSEADAVDTPQLTPEELHAIIGEAHAWKRKVAAHSHGDTAARLAVEAGVDSIEHGSFLTEKTLMLMKARGVYLVPTRMAGWWSARQADKFPPNIAAKARAAAAAHDAMFRTALRVGVPIAFGTDSGVSPHGMNAKEFSLMTELGMSPAAALLSATREGSKLLGLEGEIGTIEAGKAADLVAVPGNVLADITATEHPVYVMRAGREILDRHTAPGAR